MTRSLQGFCICFVWLVAPSITIAADGPAANSRIKLSQNFAKTPAAPWESQGKVDWQSGELIIHASGALAVVSEFGFDCEVKIDIRFPELPVDPKTSESETKVSFVEDSQDTTVIFRRIRRDGKVLASITVEEGARGLFTGRSATQVRQFAFDKDLTNGEYRIRLRQELVMIDGPGGFHGRAYADNGIDDEPQKIRVQQPKGIVRLQSCGVNSSRPVELPGTLEAVRDVQLMTQLSEQSLEFEKVGRYHDVDRVRTQVLDLNRKLFGEDHTVVALSYMAYAEAATLTRNHDEADRRYQKAIAAHERSYGPDHPMTALCCYLAASVQNNRGRWIESLKLYERAVNISEAVYPSDSPKLTIFLNNLAGSLDRLGRYREGLLHQERVLSIEAKTHGENSPQTAMAHNNLASTLNNLSRYKEAEEHWKKAIMIAREGDRPEGAVLPNAVGSLAVLYMNHDRYDEAEKLFTETLLILDPKSETADREQLIVRRNLASLRQRQGRFEEAESLMKDALHETREKLGPGHPDVALTLGNLATIYSAQLRHADAIQTDRNALKIYQRTLGHRSSDAARIQSNLANSLAAIGELGEAELFVRDAAATGRDPFTWWWSC